MMAALPVSLSHMETGKNGEGIYASTAHSYCKDQKTDQGLTLPPKIQSHDSWQYDLSQTVTSGSMDLDSLLAPGQLDMILESIGDDDTWMQTVSEHDAYQPVESTSKGEGINPIKCASHAVAQSDLSIAGLLSESESDLPSDLHQTAWPLPFPGDEDFESPDWMITPREVAHGETQAENECSFNEVWVKDSSTVASRLENDVQDMPEILKVSRPSCEVLDILNKNAEPQLVTSTSKTTSQIDDQAYGYSRAEQGRTGEEQGRNTRVSHLLFDHPDVPLPSIENAEPLHPTAVSNEFSSRVLNAVNHDHSTKSSNQKSEPTQTTTGSSNLNDNPQQDCLHQCFRQPSLLSLILALDNSSHKSLLARTILETRQYLATTSECTPPVSTSGLSSDRRIMDKLNALALMFETDKHFQRSTIAWALQRMETNNTTTNAGSGTINTVPVIKKAREFLQESVKDVDSSIDLFLKLFHDHLTEQSTLTDGLMSASVQHAKELADLEERCTKLQADHEGALRRASVFGNEVISLQGQLVDSSKQIECLEAQLELTNQGGPLSNKNTSFWICLQRKQDGQTCDALNPKLTWNPDDRELVQNSKCGRCRREVPWHFRKAIGTFAARSEMEFPEAGDSLKEVELPEEVHSCGKDQGGIAPPEDVHSTKDIELHNTVQSPVGIQSPQDVQVLKDKCATTNIEVSKKRESDEVESSDEINSSRLVKRLKLPYPASGSDPAIPKPAPVLTPSVPRGQSVALQGHSSGLNSSTHYLQSLQKFSAEHQTRQVPAKNASPTQVNNAIDHSHPLAAPTVAAASASPPWSDQYQSQSREVRVPSLDVLRPSAEPGDKFNHHGSHYRAGNYDQIPKDIVLGKLTHINDNDPHSPGFGQKIWGVWCVAGQEELTKQRLEAEYLVESNHPASATSPASSSTTPRRNSRHGLKAIKTMSSEEAAQTRVMVEVSNGALQQQLRVIQRPWMSSAQSASSQSSQSSQRQPEMIDLTTTEVEGSEDSETVSEANIQRYLAAGSLVWGPGSRPQSLNAIHQDSPGRDSLFDNPLYSQESDEGMLGDEQSTEHEYQSGKDELERDLSLALDGYLSEA